MSTLNYYINVDINPIFYYQNLDIHPIISYLHFVFFMHRFAYILFILIIYTKLTK